MSASTPFDRPTANAAKSKRSGLGFVSYLAIAAVSGLAGAYVVLSWPERAADNGSSLPTSDATEFQGNGMEGFAIREEEEIPERVRTETITIREEDTAQIDQLNGEIAELNARIAELEVLPTTVTVEDKAALEELALQMDALNAQLSEKDLQLKAMERDNLRLTAQIGEDELARRAFEEEQARKLRMRAIADARQKAADQLHNEQVNSSIIAFRRGGVEANDGGGEYDGDEAFVRAGLEKSDVTQSQVIANPSNTVVQGTLIEATLQTGLNSDQQGNVIAVISYDVWSFDLEQVLMPRGSRVFGRYSSDVGIGQKRVLVAWDRIITPDGQSVSISAYGSDRLGRSGLSGKVNNHFIERFGTAAVVSIIGAAPDVLARQAGDEGTAETLEAIGGDLSTATGSIIAEHINRPSTITIEHGDILTIIVNTDLELL